MSSRAAGPPAEDSGVHSDAGGRRAAPTYTVAVAESQRQAGLFSAGRAAAARGIAAAASRRGANRQRQ